MAGMPPQEGVRISPTTGSIKKRAKADKNVNRRRGAIKCVWAGEGCIGKFYELIMETVHGFRITIW